MSKLTYINPPGTEVIYEKFKFSQAVVCDGRVEVAGTVGIREDFTVPEDLAEQVRLAFNNLKKTLEASGSSLEKVMHLTQYFTDIKDVRAADAVFSEFYPVNYPARTVIGVAALIRPDLRMEVQATASL